MYSVYSLVDPRDNCVHYIGMSRNVQNRFRAHMHKDANWVKASWVKELKGVGLLPVLSMIAENLTREEAQKLELQMIRLHYRLGMPLTNLVGSSIKRRRWQSPVEEVQIVKTKFEELFTPKQVSDSTGLPETEIVKMLRDKEILGIRVTSRQWRIPQHVVTELQEQQRK